MLLAWREFAEGKQKKRDVQEFGLRLMDNIFALHNDLVAHIYNHGEYQMFRIADPKPRVIHKATVRDRLVHHAIYRILYPFFDRTFIPDSFSCRLNKGTHRALNRFRAFAYHASNNHTRTLWVLKCDIRKFFASIDQRTLLNILCGYIPDVNVLWLCERVIGSFASTASGKGLPLGNLTSQLFANVYMNVFDQFVKHQLHARYYLRYADDFIIMSDNRHTPEKLLLRIDNFLRNTLKLTLHPDKVWIQTYASGVDFLGWVHFPDHRILRTATKQRMFRRIAEHPTDGTFASYFGLLRHGNTFGTQQLLLRIDG